MYIFEEILTGEKISDRILGVVFYMLGPQAMIVDAEMMIINTIHNRKTKKMWKKWCQETQKVIDEIKINPSIGDELKTIVEKLENEIKKVKKVYNIKD